MSSQGKVYGRVTLTMRNGIQHTIPNRLIIQLAEDSTRLLGGYQGPIPADLYARLPEEIAWFRDAVSITSDEGHLQDLILCLIHGPATTRPREIGFDLRFPSNRAALRACVNRGPKSAKHQCSTRWFGWQACQRNETEPVRLRDSSSAYGLCEVDRESSRHGVIQSAQKRCLFCVSSSRSGFCLFSVRFVVSGKQVFCAPCAKSRLRDSKLFRNVPPTHPASAKFENMIDAKDSLRSADWQVSSGLTHSTPSDEFRLITLDAGIHPFTDDIPFKFSERSKDVQQQPGSWVTVVGVNPLSGCQEPDAAGVETSHGANNIRQRSAPAVKLPDHYRVNLSRRSNLHQDIPPRPGVLGPADGVDILAMNLPAAGLAVSPKVIQLHFAILIVRRDSGINSGFHVSSMLDGKHKVKIGLSYAQRRSRPASCRRIDGKTRWQGQGKVAHSRTEERNSPGRGAKALGRQSQRVAVGIINPPTPEQRLAHAAL